MLVFGETRRGAEAEQREHGTRGTGRQGLGTPTLGARALFGGVGLAGPASWPGSALSCRADRRTGTHTSIVWFGLTPQKAQAAPPSLHRGRLVLSALPLRCRGGSVSNPADPHPARWAAWSPPPQECGALARWAWSWQRAGVPTFSRDFSHPSPLPIRESTSSVTSACCFGHKSYQVGGVLQSGPAPQNIPQQRARCWP